METTFTKAKAIITDGKELLTDEKQKTYFNGVVESLTAAEEMADNDEKTARLTDAAIKFVNQLCFILFREELIPDELTAELRKLPSPEETAEAVRKFDTERDARIEELNKKHEEIIDEQKALDLFTAVIAGYSKEEAARKMAEHDAQIQQASRN